MIFAHLNPQQRRINFDEFIQKYKNTNNYMPRPFYLVSGFWVSPFSIHRPQASQGKTT